MRRPIIHRLQFGLQFTAVRDRPERTDQGRWPRLKRSRRPRPELLMRLGYSANSAAQNPDFGGGRCTGRSAVRSRSPAPRPGGRGAAGRWGPFRGRTLVIWTACYLDCACALTLAGIISPESAGGAVTRSARLAMALPSAKEDENGEDQARPVDQPVAGAPSGSRADTADISDTSGGA